MALGSAVVATVRLKALKRASATPCHGVGRAAEIRLLQLAATPSLLLLERRRRPRISCLRERIDVPSSIGRHPPLRRAIALSVTRIKPSLSPLPARPPRARLALGRVTQLLVYER